MLVEGGDKRWLITTKLSFQPTDGVCLRRFGRHRQCHCSGVPVALRVRLAPVLAPAFVVTDRGKVCSEFCGMSPKVIVVPVDLRTLFVRVWIDHFGCGRLIGIEQSEAGDTYIGRGHVVEAIKR